MTPSLYKHWVSQELQQKWSQSLENYLLTLKPTTHSELETAILEYLSKNG